MQETKPTPHVHAEIIKAWADGHTIEFRKDVFSNWERLSTTSPAWRNDCQYRVKPTPKPDLVYFMAMGNPSTCNNVTTIEGLASNYFDKSIDSLKLTFDGETGKLKKAEVL